MLDSPATIARGKRESGAPAVALTGTFGFSAPVGEASLRLHMSKSRHILVSALKVLLSFGPFICGAQDPFPVVQHAPDGYKMREAEP
jgi:hypothetical protein